MSVDWMLKHTCYGVEFLFWPWEEKPLGVEVYVTLNALHILKKQAMKGLQALGAEVPVELFPGERLRSLPTPGGHGYSPASMLACLISIHTAPSPPTCSAPVLALALQHFPFPSSSSQAWFQHCLLQKGSLHSFPPILHLPPWWEPAVPGSELSSFRSGALFSQG